MNKCCSTASKSLEQLVEATKSISSDGAMTSVVQLQEEQSCQLFSLRGFVADMRVKNPKVCNPFDGSNNAQKIYERLRPPLDVPRFRSLRCEICVGRVVGCSTSAEQRLNAEQNSQQICIPLAGKDSSIKHRAAGGPYIAGDSNKVRTEVIILNDSDEDRVIELTPSPEELDKGKSVIIEVEDDGEYNKASIEVIILDDSDDDGVMELTPSLEQLTTNTFGQAEKQPCLDKGKTIIIDIEDDGEEFDGQPKEIRKAIGQTSGIVKPSRKLKRGRPYGQALLDDLNARIASTANTLQNQQQQRGNISSSSNLDLSLSLCIPGTEGNQVQNDAISVQSNRKRKRSVDALDNKISFSSLKSLRQKEMSKFLKKPFTLCKIIDLESAHTDGSTREMTTAYAKHGKTASRRKGSIPRKYTKAAGESSRPQEDQHKGPGSHINELCILSRNPADFSEAGPENIYMRCENM